MFFVSFLDTDISNRSATDGVICDVIDDQYFCTKFLLIFTCFVRDLFKFLSFYPLQSIDKRDCPWISGLQRVTQVSKSKNSEETFPDWTHHPCCCWVWIFRARNGTQSWRKMNLRSQCCKWHWNISAPNSLSMLMLCLDSRTLKWHSILEDNELGQPALLV